MLLRTHENSGGPSKYLLGGGGAGWAAKYETRKKSKSTTAWTKISPGEHALDTV